MSPIEPGSGVRPTRRSIADLGIGVPSLASPLDDIDHVAVVKAQRLPELHAAGGAERIAALDDRVWFKVKTEAWRAVCCRLDLADARIQPGLGSWWLGAAGTRRADSSQDDFYEQLATECRTRRHAENQEGAGHRTDTATGHLLPGEWDRDRLYAELAEHVRGGVQRLVRRMAAESLRTGKVIGFDFQGWQARVLIRADNGHEAYVAISALGLVDSTMFVLLLTSIPGVASEDWMPEPSGIAGIAPEEGEILWSAAMPTATAERLLSEFEADEPA
ncbi:MAG: hypothetical protein ACT4QG_17440 [Sporichthyaceae bacterium]